MSKHMLGQLYRAVASHLKFAASQLYPQIAKEKSKRRKRGKKNVMVKEWKEKLYSVKDFIAKLILSLAQKRRSKQNIKLILLCGQKGLKQISEELGVSYQNLDLSNPEAEQIIAKNELCLQFEKEKQKYWQKYGKRIKSTKNQQKLKLIVDHMLICEKLNWKIQSQMGNKKPRENLNNLLRIAADCPTCSCQIGNSSEEFQHGSSVQEMSSQIIYQSQMIDIESESGINNSSARPNSESMNFGEMGIQENQSLVDEDNSSFGSLFNDHNGFDSKVCRELNFQWFEEPNLQSLTVDKFSSDCQKLSLDNIFLIESDKKE